MIKRLEFKLMLTGGGSIESILLATLKLEKDEDRVNGHPSL